MQYLSAPDDFLVASFQFFEIFFPNKSKLYEPMPAYYIYFFNAGRLRSELLLLLPVFPL